MIGEVIGRYQIIQKLGEGGMAIVYQAYDTHLESHVALKIIRNERLIVDDPNKLLQRFEAEAKRVARLSNPNIIPILDYGKHENTPYLVMKYIPGGTLKDRMGRRYNWQDAARLLIPIARALSYAHQQGIVHRDVKPGNILLTETGEPMLSDFGIAIMVLEKESEPAYDREAILGTPEYMAPEQALGKDIDHRVDIYALGLIFYEMVTGRMPFTAETPIRVLMKHIHEPVPPARQFVPDLPEIAQRVIARALEKSPDDRFSSMEDFCSALKRLAQQDNRQANTTLPLVDEEGGEEPTDPGRERGLWLPFHAAQLSGWRRISLWAAAVVVALLAIMASGIGLAMLRTDREFTNTGVFAAQPATDPRTAQSLDPGDLPVTIPATEPAAEAESAVKETGAVEETRSVRETESGGETGAASAMLPDSPESADSPQATDSVEATEFVGAVSTADPADSLPEDGPAATPDAVDTSDLFEDNFEPGSTEMRAMVRALADEGFFPTASGQYHRLADFEESWAQIGWYQWWFTDYEPTDFVVRANTTWESGSATADWFNSGCGFVFREKDPANHYMIYLGLDGFVYLRGYIDGRFRELGKEYYGKIQNVEGDAQVALVVSGNKIRYYVNGERVMQRTNGEIDSGNLSYTLVSGTNRTFGMHCAITGVELWQPDSP